MTHLPLVGRWLLTLDSDGKQHVLYAPEADQHTLSAACACIPSHDSAGVVVHATLTPNAIGVAEKEH